MEGTSLYIHIPFCIHRCGYCDFNTYAGLQRLIPSYAEAVYKEIEYISGIATENMIIKTIYFGGGTPSLLPLKEVEFILKAIKDNLDLSTDAEISLEANPGTVDKQQLNDLHQLGIGRISLGMQSANANELRMLERQHSYPDVIQAVEWARAAGIDNLNIDLIYGLPGQHMEEWLKSVEAVTSINPDHLSLYALTLEHNTPMYRRIENGTLPELDDDLAADMYEAARERLTKAGFVQYEISNWARKDAVSGIRYCEHNLQYWRNLPYIGIGAGAHGYIDHRRTENVRTPGEYIHRMKNVIIPDSRISFPSTPATLQTTAIDREAEIGETMIMGLRLVEEGVSNSVFRQRFGVSLQDHFSAQIEHFRSIGLLEWVGEQYDILRLTPKGYLLANQVFVEFI